MQKLLLTLILLVLLMPSWAQKAPIKKGASKQTSAVTVKLDRSKKPKPGPAPIINLAKAEQWTLNNGLKVFFVRDTKLPRITYQLSLDYDPILEKESAGYVSLAGELIGSGTQKMTKDELDEEIEFLGATLSTGSNGVYSFGLAQYADRLMELMSDVITKPRMESADLERIRKRTLSGIVASKTDPASISRRVANKMMYGDNHPYGESATEETVKRVTLEKCKEFYASYFRPNIGYLAIIGDITSEDAHKLVSKYLSGWQMAEVPKFSYPTPQTLSDNMVVIVDRPEAVQSVISIGTPVNYTFNDANFIKARLMNDILGGGSSARLFNNLRERHGYTYGAYSSLSPNMYLGSFTAGASVRTAVTDSSVYEFISEMRRISTEAVADSELVLSQNGVSGSFINSLENPQTVANFAINTVRYKLPPDYYSNYLKAVAAVTKADVQEQGARFVKAKGTYIVVVGKAQEIAAKLGKFGTLRYVDEQGNTVDPNPMRPVPAGVTVDGIMAKYVEAIGGKPVLAKLKDLTTVYTGEVQEQAFTLDIYRKKPNMITTVASVGMNEVDRTATNGKTHVKKGQMGRSESTGRELDNALARANFFWELDMAGAKISAKVLGVEKIGGKDAYKLEFSYPTGDTFTQYYDVGTGFMIRKTETRNTPKGPLAITTEYAEYVTVTGSALKVPSVVNLPLGPMTVNLKLKEAKVNTGIDNKVFEIAQ